MEMVTTLTEDRESGAARIEPRPPGSRRVQLVIGYDERDVDLAAQSVGIDLCSAERDSILMRLDDDFPDVIRRGVQIALAQRVLEELHSVQEGHELSEDD